MNGLATALYVEPKTATPGLYEKLGLATVEAILEGLDARLEALGEELGALAEQVGVTPLAADPGESEEAIEARLAQLDLLERRLAQLEVAVQREDGGEHGRALEDLLDRASKLGAELRKDHPVVRLKAYSGERLLADLFIGNRRFRGTAEGWFVRLPDQAQTWAVEGKLRVPQQVTEWLDSELIVVKPERVVGIVVDHGDGAPIVLSRQMGRSTLSIDNVPEGRKSKTANPASGMLRALDPLSMRDVSAADDLALGAPHTTTTWTTSDGLVVRCESWDELDGEDGSSLIRCRFSFTVDEERAPPAMLGPPVAVEGAPQQPAPREQLEDQVRSLSATTEGWIYSMPSRTASNLSTSWDDLLEEVEENEENEDERDPDENPAPVVPTVDPGGEASSGAEESTTGEATTGAEEAAGGEGGGVPD